MLVAKISDAVKRQDEIAALRQREISMESILSDVDSFAATIRNGLETLTFQEKRKLIELLVERVIVKRNDVTVENVVPLKGRFSVLCKDGRGFPQGNEAGLLSHVYQRTHESLPGTAKLSPLGELLLEISAIRSLESHLKIGKGTPDLRFRSIASRILVDLFRAMEKGGKEFLGALLASIGKPYRSTMGLMGGQIAKV